MDGQVRLWCSLCCSVSVQKAQRLLNVVEELEKRGSNGRPFLFFVSYSSISVSILFKWSVWLIAQTPPVWTGWFKGTRLFTLHMAWEEILRFYKRKKSWGFFFNCCSIHDHTLCHSWISHLPVSGSVHWSVDLLIGTCMVNLISCDLTSSLSDLHYG